MSSGHDPERIADLMDGFVEWLNESEMSEQSEAISRLVASTLTQLTSARPGFSPSAWSPADAHLLVEAAERIMDEDTESTHDTAVNLVLTSLQYLTFLDETDLWDGTEQDFAHCMEDLTDFLDGDEPEMLEPDDIVLPEVTLEQELAAITALPLLPALDAVVDRVGGGISVADDPDLQKAVTGTAIDVDTDGVRAGYWSTAIATELVRIEGDRAEPGPSAASLGKRGAETVHEMVAEHVRTQLSGNADEPDVSLSLANTFAVQTLLAAMTDDLPIDNAGEDYSELEGEDLRTAKLIDHRVHALIDQGILVRIDDALAVPHALRPAVLDGVAEARPFGTEGTNDEEPDEA